MRPIVFSVFVFFLAFSAKSQIENWQGEWTGHCQMLPSPTEDSQFGASLTIQAIDEKPNEWQWKIVYEALPPRPRQVRNYLLKTIDKDRGHFVIDEQNGIALDTFLVGQTLFSHFVINGNLVAATYNFLSESELLLQLPLFSATPIRQTCFSGNGSLCAQSLGLSSLQDCRLTRNEQ